MDQSPENLMKMVPEISPTIDETLISDKASECPNPGSAFQDVNDLDSGYDLDYHAITPDHKPRLLKVASVSPGSDHPSSKESYKSSTSSSDSELESCNSSGNAYHGFPITTNHKGVHHKNFELRSLDLLNLEKQLQKEETDEKEGLIMRADRYEEELRVSELNLQFPSDEIAKLKSELQTSEFAKVLAANFQQLEMAQREIKMRDADLEVERGKVLELRKQMSEDSFKSQGKFKLAQEEIAMLKAQVNTLLALQENFFLEKTGLESNISNLSEKQIKLEASLKVWELQGKTLEDKLRQFETEKMDMKSLHNTREICLRGEISQLKTELDHKSKRVEELNKDFDSLNLKYDMLVVEKDGRNAIINKLTADVSCREDKIRVMEEHLRQLQMGQVQLIAGSESAKKLADELRLKVIELEEEVDRLRNEVLVGAEEKREAIRQLCFSLEHYRSGYAELRDAFFGHKQRVVMASQSPTVP